MYTRNAHPPPAGLPEKKGLALALYYAAPGYAPKRTYY
jgi:hypothetical protein